MDNSKKIILDLCGGTGSWSRPYAEAGYDVRVITLPYYDILTYEPPKNVYGILAAPPCTAFSIAGSQYWQQKDLDGRTQAALKIVNRCLDIANFCKPKFFSLENPRGRLPKFIGEPTARLNYLDFGCDYFKTVYLWGYFSIPIGNCYCPKASISLTKCSNNSLSEIPLDYSVKGSGMSGVRAIKRSITFKGFADAFYLVNQ